MKILQIITSLSSGGAEKLISDIVPRIRDKGHDVEVLLLQRIGSIYIEHLTKLGIKVSWLSESSLYSILNFFRIRRYILKGQFDVIHVHLFPGLYYVGFLSILGSFRFETRIIYTRHYTKSIRTRNFAFSAIDRFMYRGYDHIIAISESVKESILSERKINESKITVVRNGVDIQKFADSQPAEGSELYSTYRRNHKVITMVSRFSRTKDHETVIRALRELPSHINLILVGEGEKKIFFSKLVAELNIAHRVHFLGMRNDIPEILKASDIGILSSKMEGMPITALEIFASGIPFIGSNVKGISDLFVNYDSSICLFDYKDSNALAKLTSDILVSDTIRNRNITICQEIVSAFSLDRMVGKYLDVYSYTK